MYTNLNTYLKSLTPGYNMMIETLQLNYMHEISPFESL